MEKKIGILKNREKYAWVLIRRTRIPNFIPIGQWERGEKSGEPKTGRVSGPLRGGRGADFKTEKNIHGQSSEEHVYQILTQSDDGKGGKNWENPKQGRRKEGGRKVGEDTRSKCQICLDCQDC